MATQAQILLTILLEAIHNGNDDDLRKYISALPLDEMDVNTFESTLGILLETARNADNKSAAHVIIDTFSELGSGSQFDWKGTQSPSELTESSLPLITYLFTQYRFSSEMLTFLVESFPDITLMEHMVNLCDFEGDNNDGIIRVGINRLSKLYNEQDMDTYDRLLAIAEEKECDAVEEFCEMKLQHLSPPVGRPRWLWKGDNCLLSREDSREDPQGDDNHRLPEENEPLNINEDSAGSANDDITRQAEYLVERIVETEGVDIDDADAAAAYLGRIIASATEEDRSILCQTTKPSESWVRLFRWLGPSNNRLEKAHHHTDNICSRYGCRMFTCIEFETTDDDDDYIDPDADWFTGGCMFCLLKIPNRYWSVREPLPHGGWSGCYCSWSCVRKTIVSRDADGERPEFSARTDPREHAEIGVIIARIEADMHRIGIQDRRVREVLPTSPAKRMGLLPNRSTCQDASDSVELSRLCVGSVNGIYSTGG